MTHPVSNYAQDILVNLYNMEDDPEREVEHQVLEQLHDILVRIEDDQITITTAREELRQWWLTAKKQGQILTVAFLEQANRQLEALDGQIIGVPTQVILQNYVRAHLDECQQCQEGQQQGATLVAITAHIFHDPLIKQLRVGLRDLVPIVRQELSQRPTYQQLLSLVRDYYFLTLESAPHTFWKQKDLYDEQARAILEKLGEPTEREWEIEEDEEEA